MSKAQAQGGAGATPEDDEEDDYMNMSFADPEPPKETSVARAQRLKRESRARGVIKSKAEREAEEAAARDKALSTSMLDDPRAKKSKGLAMMAKMGFTGGSLGAAAAKNTPPAGQEGESTAPPQQARTEPIKLDIKGDRGGIGLDTERKRKVGEAEEREWESARAKGARLDPLEYRDRVAREREEARREKQFYAAQRMAQRLDEDSGTDADDDAEAEATTAPTASAAKRSAAPPALKSVPLVYRGLVKHRAEQERDRRRKQELEESLSRLPRVGSNDNDDDEDEDDDDRMAMGKDRNDEKAVYAETEGLEDEDEELEQFDALSFADRLEKVLGYLRDRHRYCFWCKAAYPDEQMDGCPGLTEEEHD